MLNFQGLNELVKVSEHFTDKNKNSQSSLWTNVSRALSLKAHVLCQNSKVVSPPVHQWLTEHMSKV